MSKIELTISPDYVPTWTLVDAVRELFQNALDQEVQQPSNGASWDYNPVTQTLSICNRSATLATSTLLLGATSKDGAAGTIGQFGEGYKIATLVLLRNHKQVTFYNYGAREVWRPRFVKSRRFGTDVLTFFIDKKHVWESVPSNDLTIEISGITSDEYFDQLVPANLHLQPEYAIEDRTERGEILSSDTHRGLVFVNGLYVCKYDEYRYGYNFKPGVLKLDRDRKLASDFDLKWAASTMWVENPRAVTLLEEGCADVSYVSNLQWMSDSNMSIEAFEHFRKVHGPNAVPVTSQDEYDSVPSGYKPVLTNYNYASLIRNCSRYAAPPEEELQTPLNELLQWYEEIKSLIPGDKQEQFDTIYNKLL